MKKLKDLKLTILYTKLLALLIIPGLTLVSCTDSGITSSKDDLHQANVQKALAEKLGPDMSLEEWGMTMEEFERAYNATQSQALNTTTLVSDSIPPPPDWESNYGTELNIGDDDCKNVDIGFEFTFYGKSFTTLWVNSNGNLTFDDCNTRFWPTNIPDSGGRVIIAPLYGDFVPEVEGSDTYINILGDAPNRTFVITWLDMTAFNQTGINTFQVQLSESTNNILFGYNGITTGGINTANSRPMNVGISADSETYINSATAEEIPKLDGTNICYLPDGDGYEEKFAHCDFVNTPPITDAGPDQTLECEGDSTAVSLDGSGSADADGDSISYSWTLNENEIATDEAPSFYLPMGSHTITLTTTDSHGATSSDDVIIDIVDTTAPELSYTVNTTYLWPPNNDMHLSVSGISTSDICDSDPSLSVTVSVSNSRQEDSSDWDVLENDDGTIDVYLRAKPARGRSDRNYTLTIVAEDASANAIEETVNVSVSKPPKS